MIAHVLIQVKKAHADGVVHRNITFDTIVFKENRWKLIGWEYSAAVDTVAPIPPRSYYLDAKQLHSLMHNVPTEKVRKSVDIWAVAMVFFECVTRKRAFFNDCDRDIDQVGRHGVERCLRTCLRTVDMPLPMSLLSVACSTLCMATFVLAICLVWLTWFDLFRSRLHTHFSDMSAPACYPLLNASSAEISR